VTIVDSIAFIKQLLYEKS